MKQPESFEVKIKQRMAGGGAWPFKKKKKEERKRGKKHSVKIVSVGADFLNGNVIQNSSGVQANICFKHFYCLLFSLPPLPLALPLCSADLH